MQKLKIHIKKADFNLGKYVEEDINKVVASTKSQNNFVEELQSNGHCVISVTANDIFLDRAKTVEVFKAMIKEQCKEESEETINGILELCCKAFETTCIFDKSRKNTTNS